ncbi:MAG: chemotaxis protein CheW [Desulfobacteraceae bacterium]|jgi:purine-binding chemotaxis protein CheW
MKLLTFYLNEESYAIPVADLTEVNRMAGIRIVPKAPEYVVGLLNLHGAVAPVLNLKSVLQLSPWQPAPQSMWIAVKHHGIMVCLVVDKLDRIMEVPRRVLDETPTLSKGVETRYLKCCARIENAIVPVLAVDDLLDEKKSEVLAKLLNNRL